MNRPPRRTSVRHRRVGRWLSLLAAPARVLTPLGRGVLVLGLLATALSARLHWHEFTQLAVVALGLLVLGLLWQLLPGAMVAELALRRDRVVEGRAAQRVTLDVQAGSAPMLFPKVQVQVGGMDLHLRLPFLAPFGRHREDLTLPDLPRGVHSIGPVTYEKIDPVGLVSRTFETGRALELFVSPRVSDLAVFAGGLTNDLDGATSQQLSMSDLAFHALREYVQGDDLRHVHWRSSAKAGQLLVRQYHETRRGHVTVIVDGARASYPDPSDFELAVSVATSIALRAVRDDFDTYLRCGPHLVHSRDTREVMDAACRFTVGADHYLEHAGAAAESIHGTGLVVQVTGASRDLVELDGVATLFGRGADWIVVRADNRSRARVRDIGTLRELSVSDLTELQDLFARGMR